MKYIPLLCLLPTLAVAQEPTDVSPLVVSATRVETPLNQVASSLTLISTADLQDHQWRTAADALALTPGLNIVQTGGPGGLTSVFIRGANSNHTKVLIDGIEVNDPSQSGAFEFGQVLTSDLARIEVLRGPQSSLYGADALGGVITLVTKVGEGPLTLAGSLEGGSFATFNQTAGLSGGKGPLHLALNLAHFRSANTPVTPLDLLPPGQKRIGDFYENETVSTKLGWDITRTVALDFTARYTDGHLKTTGDDFSVFPSVPAAAQTDQTSHQLFTRGQVRFSLFDDRLKSGLGLGYTRYRTRLQGPDVPFGPQAPTFDRGDRLKIDWLNRVTLAPDQTLAFGVENTVDRLINSPVSASKRDTAGWAEIQAKPVTGLTVAASVRYDDDQRFGGKATWRIAPVFHIPATGTILRASYGTGFKAPTLNQLFVSFPAFNFFANPDLRPETSTGYDLGFEQPLAQGKLAFGVTGFRNRIRDLIDSNDTFTSYANVGRATTWGVESFVAARPTKTLSVRLDYSYIVARNDITDQDLLRRPHHKLTVTNVWRATEKLKLSSNLLYLGSWVDGNRSFSISRLQAKGYVTANIAADYALTRQITVFGRIDNLLDRRYENPVGFQRPGRGLFAGVRFERPLGL